MKLTKELLEGFSKEDKILMIKILTQPKQTTTDILLDVIDSMYGEEE